MTPLAGASVLLLEDEYLIALDAEQILAELGAAAVDIVGTLGDARKRADSGRYDLVVLDVNINGEMSFEVAELFKARGIPIVFATGYELRGRSWPDRSIHVAKPYTLERMRDATAAALLPARIA